VIARQLGGHQALAIFWADHFNHDDHTPAGAARPQSRAA